MLLGIVVVMGVMIVAGVAGLVGVIVHRAAHPHAGGVDGMAQGRIEDAGRGPGVETSLPVPAGSRIISYRTAQNGTVIVHVRGTDTDRLVIWNPLTGLVIGSLDLAPPVPNRVSP